MSNATMTFSQSEVTTSGEPSRIQTRGHHHGDGAIGEGHGEVEYIHGHSQSKLLEHCFVNLFLPLDWNIFNF